MLILHAQIFASIKNNTLIDDLNKYDNEQLKDFLPLFMIAAFPKNLSLELVSFSFKILISVFTKKI